MGYVIAWERRRALLSVLVPVLIPAQLILLVFRMLSSPEDIAVINGELIVPVLDGAPGITAGVILVAAWLFAITAAIVVAGQDSPGTGESLDRAAKVFPLQALWALAAAAVSFLVLLVAAQLSWLGIALLVVLAFVLARLSLSLASRALALPPSPPPRGRSLGAAGRILLGAVIVPFLAAAGLDLAGRRLLELQPSIAAAVAVHAAGTLLLVAVVAVQAGTLVTVYLSLRDEQVPTATPTARGWVVAATALLLPAVLIAAITPWYGSQVTVRQNYLSSAAEEIVVVDGQPPVIFTRGGVRRCDDLLCTADGAGEGMAVGVGADGAFLSASWSRDGSDELEVTRCAPSCDHHGTVTLLENSALKPLPLFDIAAAADGTVWIALAQQPTELSPTIELSLIHCAASGCRDHRRFPAGAVDGTLSRGEWEGERYAVHMRLTPDGRPVAEFGFPELTTVACDSPACTGISVTHRSNPAVGAMSANGSPQAFVVTDLGTFMVTAETAPPETGFHLRIGSQAPIRERLALWVCDTLATCADGRRIPLHIRELPPVQNLVRPKVRLAVLPSGTVLIAEGTTVVTVRP